MKIIGSQILISLRGLAASRRRLAILLTACVLGLTASAAFAHDDPEIFPIQSQPYGKTYGQWGVAWWKWALSIPAANNPVTDETGEFAGEAQSGPVWFVAGTFANAAERTFTVPRGKALFIPIHTWIFGAMAGDCDPSNPGVPCDLPTLRAAAEAAATSVQTMEVFIDGKMVRHLRDYRATSPGGFKVTLPEDAVLGLPAGTFGPQVADGYWLMLEPLDPGKHTIIVRAVNPAYGLDYTVIHHITVKGRPHDSSDHSD